MKHLFVLFFILAPLGYEASAQIVVDLKKGATSVRAKTLADYEAEQRMGEVTNADTIKYKDCLRRALNALFEDSLKTARELLEESLRIYPDAPSRFIVRHNLGKIDMAEGKMKSAIVTFSEILKSHPENSSVRFDRATAYLENNEPQGAINDCNVLLKTNGLDSLHERLYFMRGAAEMQLRLIPAAKQDMENVLTINPQNESAALLYVMILEKDGRKRESSERLDAFISAHPQNADALLMHADRYAEEGRDDLARYDYDLAVERFPSDPRPYVHRANWYKSIGNEKAARKDLDKAATISEEGQNDKQKLP